jgi:glucose-1-phosphate adenylyltransferase
VRIYTPYKGRSGSDWYGGTADAVQQNFRFIKNSRPDLVLILSGDHIYQMNYDALIAFHGDHRADATMCTIRVPFDQASRFGIVEVDGNFQVSSFVEKPPQPSSNLANMGVYVFSVELLDRVLWDDRHRDSSSHDFGKDILPRLISQNARVGLPYTGYW